MWIWRAVENFGKAAESSQLPTKVLFTIYYLSMYYGRSYAKHIIVASSINLQIYWIQYCLPTQKMYLLCTYLKNYFFIVNWMFNIKFLDPMFSVHWSPNFCACASLKSTEKNKKISLGSKNMMLNIRLLLFTKHSFDDLPVMDEWLVETYFIKGMFAKSFYYKSHAVGYFYFSIPTIYGHF